MALVWQYVCFGAFPEGNFPGYGTLSPLWELVSTVRLENAVL